jgi:hypothetical protein
MTIVPAKLNTELFDRQDDTFVLTFYDGKRPVATKLFNPGSYDYVLVWVNTKYREGYGWTVEVKIPQVNNRPPIKVMRADGEVR